MVWSTILSFLCLFSDLQSFENWMHILRLFHQQGRRCVPEQEDGLRVLHAKAKSTCRRTHSEKFRSTEDISMQVMNHNCLCLILKSFKLKISIKIGCYFSLHCEFTLVQKV